MSPERRDMGDRTNHHRWHLDRGRGFKSGGKHFFTHGMRGHASQYRKYGNACGYLFTTEHVGTLAGTAATPKKRRHKASSEENKQFDPGGKGEKAPPWNAAVTLLFFLGRAGRLLACASCSLLVLRVFLSVLCVCLFPKLLFFPGDHFSAS